MCDSCLCHTCLCQANIENQFPTIPLAPSQRMRNAMRKEWGQQMAMGACKAKDDKKFELIELEEQGLVTDDTFHVATSKLGEAPLCEMGVQGGSSWREGGAQCEVGGWQTSAM